MAFIPYADPNLASASLSWDTDQYGSIVPFTNDTSGVTSAYSTPGYQEAAVISAGGMTGNEYDSGSYSGSGGTSGGTTSTAPTYDPNVLAYYANLTNNVNTQLGRLPTQEQVGTDNITNAYNSSYNQLQDQNAVATRNYNTTKTQTAQDNVAAKNRIDSSVGQQTSALQRLLGSRGAGNSSAARFMAPYAAAKFGSLQRNDVNQAFGRNNQALDTNFGDFTRQWSGAVGDLARQKDTQVNTLKSTIATNKQSLLSQLANIASQRAQALGQTYQQAISAAAPFQSQINSLGGEIDQLGRQYANPVVQAQNVSYKAPDLAQYNYQQAQAPQVSQSSLGQQINPYLSLLFGKDKQQQFIGA